MDDEDAPHAGPDAAGDAGAGEATLRLDDALKLAGLAETGGQAKHRIQAGEVTVNGVIETRRKRRLRRGDVVGIDGETFEIDLEDGEA